MAESSEHKPEQELREAILRLQQRVEALEDALDVQADFPPQPVVQKSPVPSDEVPPRISIPPPLEALESIATRQPEQTAPESLFRSTLGESWEATIGGRWLTWLGTASLILAVAYFVPWAWRHFALPAWFRVLVFHFAGIGVLAVAWWIGRKQLPALARGVAGLGIFILYTAAYVMHHHYHLWGDASGAMTFLDCALITAVTITIALRANSVAIVLLGALGGYLTPILASTGGGEYVVTFVYLAFLNIALIACAMLRPWRFLKPMAVVATAVMFLLWMESPQSTPSTTWGTEWLLVLHALIFLTGTTLAPLGWRQTSTAADLAALVVNSVWFVGATWLLFHDSPEQQMAAVCWGMSALHAVLFVWTTRRVTHIDRLPRVQLALATLFFTLAVPLQMRDSLDYLAYAWALEGFVFTGIAVYYCDLQMARTGMIVLGLALVRAIVFDFTAPPEMLGTSGLDRRMLVMLVSGLATMAAGSCYWWVRRMTPPRETAPLDPQDGAILLGLGNVVTMIGLTCQWDHRLVLVLWTLDAAMVWVAAFRANNSAARVYALLLSVLLVGGRALFHGDAVSQPYQLLLNARFGSLALVAMLYFVAGWVHRQSVAVAGQVSPTPAPSDFEHGTSSLLHLLGNLSLLSAITMEVHNWHDPAGDWPRHISMAEQVSYSVVWAIYAAVLVAAGFLLKYQLPRLLGLLGFLAVVLKVFFVDLGNLSLILRVLALSALGAMLLITSFLYQKFTARLEDHES